MNRSECHIPVRWVEVNKRDIDHLEVKCKLVVQETK